MTAGGAGLVEDEAIKEVVVVVIPLIVTTDVVTMVLGAVVVVGALYVTARYSVKPLDS
jgi:hypothetical protein